MSDIFCHLVPGHHHFRLSRDLKPENLLLEYLPGGEHVLRIVDFGLGTTIQPSGSLLLTACGSPCYAPPEMIAGVQYVGSRVDVWNTGVILYALLCGHLPFTSWSLFFFFESF